MSSGIPERTRILVAESRDDGMCRRCGRPGESIHHRIPRGMGGSRDPKINSPANLVLVCGHGTAGCHGHIESHRSEAYLSGWLVHRTEDPESIPLLDLAGVAWCLTSDGLAIPSYRKVA